LGEADWRQWAEEILPLLRELFASDDDAATAEAEIVAALAERGAAAVVLLRRALTRRKETREWVRLRAGDEEPAYRIGPADGTDGPDDGDDPDREGARYLGADVPGQAPVGRRFSLQARVLLKPPEPSATPLRPFIRGGGPASVTISVLPPPGLRATGELEQELTVPADADSDPVRFGFVADRAGLHTLVVRAFAGGSFLGEVAAQVSAEVGVAFEDGRTAAAAIATPVTSPGEVTLQVFRHGDHHLFQLLGDSFSQVEPLERLAGNPADTVNGIHRELEALVRGRSGFATPALARRRLAAHGAALWANAVPDAIRRRFWEQADRITSFTIACDADLVPWELLYAADGANELGFLAQKFPVTRRVTNQRRVQSLPLASASYIVPPGSPSDATAEVEAVRARLGRRVLDGGTVSDLEDLLALVDAAPPSLLHFACHNTFSDREGSEVMMRGGPFRPVDLELAKQRRALARSGTLVFFNACRSAGETQYLAGTMGWAKQFMKAGAGAFVGALWPVRSPSARAFAEAFYLSLAADGQTLGQATLTARRAIRGDDDDPTWLAYTVYGNPAATPVP
jgi:hypothetical protein